MGVYKTIGFLPDTKSFETLDKVQPGRNGFKQTTDLHKLIAFLMS